MSELGNQGGRSHGEDKNVGEEPREKLRMLHISVAGNSDHCHSCHTLSMLTEQHLWVILAKPNPGAAQALQ